MNHTYNKQKTPAVWDYAIDKLDFSHPEVMRWYLKRRIEHADWKGLNKKDLKEHLPYLEISSEMKQVLASAIS